MMNWRTACVLLGVSSLLACATATNDGFPDGDPAGANNGGGPPSESGAPAGGAANPGAGALNGGAGAPVVAGSANGGSVGHAGAAGAATGGHSGTSSAGAGGAAGKGGTASVGGASGASGGSGGASSGACANPKDVSMGTSGNFGTKDAVCLRTMEKFNSINCSSFSGRTIKVNGTLETCTGVKGTFAPAIDGYNYFDVSAGDFEYAGFVWYSS